MTWKDRIKAKGLHVLVLKTIMFLLILLLLDFVIGNILANLYEKQKSGEIFRTTYSIDSTKADILIFGSSRANHHYIPSIFNKRMNLSCYNTGRDGETIFYNYSILKSVLKRYTPKMVILDISREEFRFAQISYDRLSALIPYYKKHIEIRPTVEIRSPYEKYKLVSRIYPYNSLIFTILMGATDFDEKRKPKNDQDGYVPLDEIFTSQLAIDTIPGTNKLDLNKINTFKSFIEDCEKSKVKLYIVISPLLIKFICEDPSVNMALNMAHTYKLPVFSFVNNPVFFNNKLFADQTHLNNYGAKLLTNLVIDSITSNQ